MLRKLLPASERGMANPEYRDAAHGKTSMRISGHVAALRDGIHRHAMASRQRPIRATLIVVAFLFAILGLAKLVRGQEILYEVYSPVVSRDQPIETVVTTYSPAVGYTPVTTYRPVTAYEPLTTTTYKAEMVYEPVTTTAYKPVTVSEPVTTYSPITSYLPTTSYSPVVTYKVPTVVAPAYVPTVVARPVFVPGEPVRNVLRALWY